jgi:hypothetical protein
LESSLPRLLCPYRVLSPVSADTNAAHWENVPFTPLLDSVSGSEPVQATRFRVVHDERELRVLFAADDVHPWANYTQRDDPLYEEEVVEVFLDPVGDLEGYFEFEVNPKNARLDLVLRRVPSGYRKDFRWRCEGFVSEVRISNGIWTTEMAIPFASLGNAVPAGEWRANFYRIDRPPGQPWELSAWSPTRVAAFHVAQRFGILAFQD